MQRRQEKDGAKERWCSKKGAGKGSIQRNRIGIHVDILRACLVFRAMAPHIALSGRVSPFFLM